MSLKPDLARRLSETEAVQRSSSFEMLHDEVKRWIWSKGWEGLRDIQEKSIPILLKANTDLIISSGTASGKTEAAFLPIISNIAANPPASDEGVIAICVAPMRALLNDAMPRIESLAEGLKIPITKWHGDVGRSAKDKLRKNPQGILLITPESLEAILVLQGSAKSARLFRGIRYMVIDEMHSFMDSPRGKQLQALMHRIDLLTNSSACRVGLSATLADEATSRTFLRPLSPDKVTILPPTNDGGALRLQLRGYISEPPKHGPRSRNEDDEVISDGGEREIIKHIYDTCRGGRNLIFAGARTQVEKVTVALNGLCDAAGVTEEFLPHHGNLSRELREYSEAQLKDETKPCSVVCTTTLELGIDVGPIESVAQLGPGHTVSGMRQRLGRTGRRPGQDSVMRIYVRETGLFERSHPLDGLRRDTVQSIAMTNLMLRRWNEPPRPGRLNLSTLLHQILALIAQQGGITPADVWKTLIMSNVFQNIELTLFKSLLRQMALGGLIEQTPDGLLLPGTIGEKIIENYNFYAVFATPEEFRVIADDGRTIGSMPVENPVVPGQFVILGARRWKVIEVKPERKEILVTPASGGRPPIFGGEPRSPHDVVIQEMFNIYRSDSEVSFLDNAAKSLLAEARETFGNLKLDEQRVTLAGGNILLFPWVGDQKMTALLLALCRADLEPTHLGLALSVPMSKLDELKTALRSLVAGPPLSALDLARFAKQPAIERYDELLGFELQQVAYASEYIDASSLSAIAKDLLQPNQQHLPTN